MPVQETGALVSLEEIAAKLVIQDADIRQTIAQIMYDLNAAVIAGHSFFAICEYDAPRMDKGNTYYSLYYVKDNRVTQVYAGDSGMPYLGAQKSRHLGFWTFVSGAIGSNRLTDATKYFRSLLYQTTGTKITFSTL